VIAGRADTPERCTLMYSDLLAAVEKIAKQLCSALDAAQGPRHVAYLVHPGLCYVVFELAVWAAGAVAIPLSVHSPAPELEYFCSDGDAAVLVGDASSLEKLKTVAAAVKKPVMALSMQHAATPSADSFSLESVLDVVPDVSKRQKVSDETDAHLSFVTLQSNSLILYTSGTTGKPKGVVHTFESLSAQTTSLSEAWQWTKADHTLHVLPLHHIHGVQNILNTALMSGACVEFAVFDAKYCLDRISSGEITCFHAVPTIYMKFMQHLEKLSEQDKAAACAALRQPAIRLMVCGSAALPIPTMKAWATLSGHVLLERYGMTEIGMGLSNKYATRRYPGCVGWPLPLVEIKQDADGQILVKGPTVFKEYYKKPEATAESFTADGWFQTGDTGGVGGDEEELKKTVEGAIEVEVAAGKPQSQIEIPSELQSIYRIMGRTSVDIIKSGGYKLSALEIEAVLLTHDAITEVAVVGMPDETWGERVVAVVVLQEGQQLELKALRDWGKERVATYKVPQELHTWDALPRNQLGKVEKKKITAQL